MLQQAVIRIKSLQKPTTEIAEIIKSIYNTPAQQSTINSNLSIFGNTSTAPSQSNYEAQNTSIFAQASQNLFGKQSNQTPQLPNSGGSLFGGTQTHKNQPQSISQNIFAQANANLIQQNSVGIFGNQQNNAVSSEPPNNFPSKTWLGQQPSEPNMFSHKSEKIFQQNVLSTTSNIFGNQNISTISQPSTPIIFAGNSNTQVNTTQQTSMFGSQNFLTSTPELANLNKGSIFGNQSLGSVPTFQANKTEPEQSSNIFGTQLNPPSIDESLYSKLEDLTEDEIKWFQSDNLDPLNIPEKPPTYDMCF